MADVPEMEPRSRADSEPGATTAGETVVPTLGHGSQTIGPGVTTKVRHHCSLFKYGDRVLMNSCALFIV